MGGSPRYIQRFRTLDVSRSVKGSDCPSVATHCLLQTVVALVTRTRGLKAILLEDRSDESARVCS